MDTRNEIKMLAAKKGITLTYLANYLSNRTNKKYSLDLLSKKLKANSIRYTEMKIIAEALGMELLFKEMNP